MKESQIKKSKVLAKKMAKELGYSLGEFKANGDLWVARCSKTLELAIVHPDGRIGGTATQYPCDKDSREKQIEFDHAPLSPEMQKNFTAPWRPPFETK